MGFKDYKIRDGVHIPSEKYRENYDAIFKKKKKQADMQSDNIEMKTFKAIAQFRDVYGCMDVNLYILL